MRWHARVEKGLVKINFIRYQTAINFKNFQMFHLSFDSYLTKFQINDD